MNPITLEIRVKPNARVSELIEETDGTWSARVKAPPADGRANEAWIALIARRFGCPKSAVSIRHGGRGRTKLVAIARP